MSLELQLLAYVMTRVVVNCIYYDSIVVVNCLCYESRGKLPLL